MESSCRLEVGNTHIAPLAAGSVCTGGDWGVTSSPAGVMRSAIVMATSAPKAAAAKPIPIRRVGSHGNVKTARTVGMTHAIPQNQ